jgi:lipoprotein-releasing system permease protein
MLSLFIARRLYRNEAEEGASSHRRASRPAAVIATAGVAIGLAIMLLSVAIAVGFKSEVRSKISGFGSDIQITNFNAVRSYETNPICANDSLFHALYALPEVKHVQRFSTKLGILKTDSAYLGVVVKGVGKEFDNTFFHTYLKEGEIPQFSDTVASNQILISQTQASKLKLHIGDKVYAYFVEDNVRARRFTVKGIYQTGLADYDNLFILTDIYTVNRLRKWKTDQVSGLEIQLKDFGKLKEVAAQLAYTTDQRSDKYGQQYYVRDIEQLNPQMFGWLDMLDTNVWVILLLMIGVAGFTVISGLLILILERTQTIGLLKALGASNRTIRHIFLWLAVFLIGKGMLWGNLIAIVCYVVQKTFGIFTLDPETYFVNTVPMSLNIGLFLLLNAGTLLVSVLMLIGPSYLTARINPATSMRYE